MQHMEPEFFDEPIVYNYVRYHLTIDKIILLVVAALIFIALVAWSDTLNIWISKEEVEKLKLSINYSTVITIITIFVIFASYYLLEVYEITSKPGVIP
jgi:ABC-type sulfate transport system permease component